MALQPGQLIVNGKYRIEALIGEGAFGEVYLAMHLDLKQSRALKILRRDRPGVGSTEVAAYEQRFLLEAQLGARLTHPNLIRVYDFERDGAMLILGMDYAPGGSLADRIKRARADRHPIPVMEAVRIGLDIAEGLAVLHDQDIVHRDLKPGNILLDAAGRARVADLGLAQTPADFSQREELGSLAPVHPGTPAYMSPEQLTSRAYLTSASDVYALGCVLFEVLTNRPYQNQPPGTRADSLRPKLPGWLTELVGRLLAPVSTERPWNGRAVVEPLRAGKRQLDAQLAAGRRQRAEQDVASAKEAAEATRLAEQQRAEQAAAEATRRQEAEERARREAAERAEEAKPYFERGKAHYNKKDYDNAIAEFTTAIDLDPYEPEYHKWRGWSYDWKRDYEQAIVDHSKAIELAPQNAEYWRSRSASYHNKGYYDRAIADESKAIELAPQNAAYWNSRGVSYHEKRD